MPLVAILRRNLNVNCHIFSSKIVFNNLYFELDFSGFTLNISCLFSLVFFQISLIPYFFVEHMCIFLLFGCPNETYDKRERMLLKWFFKDFRLQSRSQCQCQAADHLLLPQTKSDKEEIELRTSRVAG